MATCEICHGFNELKVDDSDRKFWHGWERWVDSATKGCETCSIITDGIATWFSELSTEAVSVLGEPILYRFGISRSKAVAVLFAWRSTVPTFHLQFYTQPGSKAWPRLNTGPMFNVSLDLAQCIAFVQGCLQQCSAEHKCLDSSLPSELPTRVINVGLENCSELIRLEDGLDRRAHYIALSHCWGSSAALLKTHKATLIARRENIPLHTLPKTFSDAIDITRRLGIRYLWIDSLCIIQDDSMDWAHESSQMAGVYSSAFLTIAATGAFDSTNGCLFPRSLDRNNGDREDEVDVGGAPLPIRSSKIQRTVSGQSEVIFIRAAPLKSHDQLLQAERANSYNTSHNNVQAPLMQRAWAFQERLLSPRVLHFHTEEMMWQCREQYACECGTLQHEFAPVNLVPQQYQDGLFAIWKPTISVDTLLRVWYKIVAYYSQLALTYESDRLPALSGIASFVARRVEGAYVAGLWRADFVKGLSWKKYRLGHMRRIDGVPSWSWASLQSTTLTFRTGVRYDDGNLTPSARTQVIDVQCVLQSDNAYGSVTRGLVTIAGPSIPVMLQERRSYPENDKIVYFGHNSKWHGQDRFVNLDVGLGHDHSEVASGDVLCALLLGTTEVETDLCLLLKPLPSQLYTRVGIAYDFFHKRWFENANIETVNII